MGDLAVVALPVAPPFPGAALRVMRTAAGRRALQLGLLVGGLSALGFIGGGQAHAADASSPAVPTDVVRSVQGPFTLTSPRDGVESVGDTVARAVGGVLGEPVRAPGTPAHRPDPSTVSAAHAAAPLTSTAPRHRDAAPTGTTAQVTDLPATAIASPSATATATGSASITVKVERPESRTTPSATPSAQTAPATDPAPPATDAASPVSDAPQPAPDAPRPVTHVLQPVTDAVPPTGDVLHPVTDALQPVTGALRPVTDALQPATGVLQPVTGVVEPVGDLVGDVVGTVVEGLGEVSAQFPAWPEEPSGPSVPSVPGFPELPGLPGLPGTPELPAPPGADQVLPAPVPAPVSPQEPATAERGADDVSAGAVVAYGPRAGTVVVSAVGSEGQVSGRYAGGVRTVPLPSHQAPDGDPAHVLNNGSAADGGAPRHADAHAVTSDLRAPLRLVPGAAEADIVTGTRDRHRDIPEFPG
ncbi:hypothetical protein [Streptomyces sp. NPDC005301]|uniref:hypothetical protein n=1 Tax=Streptomyces sp. NPDC005301 TaxID=3156874 RepID=UPI0033B897FD